jgi:hypothetical protein
MHVMVLGEYEKNVSGLTLEDAHECQLKAQHSAYWTEGPSLCSSVRLELSVTGVGRYRASMATRAATHKTAATYATTACTACETRS